MAVFNIQRFDSMPPLIVSMRVAGTDPEQFYDFDKDDVGGTSTDNAGPLPNGVQEVRFIMKNLQTNVIAGLPANVANGFTGFGVIYQEVIPDQFEDEAETIPRKKTLLRYNWQPPATDFVDPVSTPNAFPGDTGIVGIYAAEFEIIYSTAISGFQRRKRTFPSTPNDVLRININDDVNGR